MINRYIDLFCLRSSERYSGEKEKILDWAKEIAINMITHTSIDPLGRTAFVVITGTFALPDGPPDL